MAHVGATSAADTLRDQLTRWLRPAPDEEVGEGGDFRLNPGATALEVFTQAAVLVPVVDRPDGATVLLTLRTDHLNDHAGQVSFPGGRVEPEDRDVVETALRETEEEVGLARDLVQVVGFLDRYRTVTGFDIQPVVGLVAPGFEVTPDPFEVAEVFEIPFELVLEERSFRRQSRLFRGTPRHFYEIAHDRHYIWGATAGILRGLCLRSRCES